VRLRASQAVQHEAIADTTFSRATLRGAAVRPFRTVDGWVAEAAAAGPGYTVVYVDDVDAAGHEHGPGSDEHAAAAAGVLDGLTRLAERLSPGGETLLLITADHGQVRVDPATTVYLNERLPELTPHLRGGGDGRPLAPAGSARDLFLHVLPGHDDDVEWLLEDLLGETAEVRLTRELVEDGVFGSVGQRLRERIGEVVVLPAPGESVWWREPGRFDMRFRGHHGGLSPDEMLIPLAALPLG
jgi:predicted AlkP superfamily pyrophosphatase or phosphodiesterase